MLRTMAVGVGFRSIPSWQRRGLASVAPYPPKRNPPPEPSLGPRYHQKELFSTISKRAGTPCIRRLRDPSFVTSRHLTPCQPLLWPARDRTHRRLSPLPLPPRPRRHPSQRFEEQPGRWSRLQPNPAPGDSQCSRACRSWPVRAPRCRRCRCPGDAKLISVSALFGGSPPVLLLQNHALKHGLLE